MSEAKPLHLVLGDEELLVERAVADVLRSARQRAGTADVPVSRMRAGDVGAYELAELLSPSLFAEERIVVLGAAAEAGKDAAAVIESAAADLPAGTVLVVVHSGGGRAKSLANQLRSMGAQVHPCARITKVSERADFIRSEFASLRVKVDDETVTACWTPSAPTCANSPRPVHSWSPIPEEPSTPPLYGAITAAKPR